MRVRFVHQAVLGILLICPLTDIGQEKVEGCTIGVACGKATADGRPLLWGNDDEVGRDNDEVVYLRDGRFKYLGVVVANSEYFRAGVNEFGFCMVSSLAFNLKGKSENYFDIMRLALQQCITAEDFENLLKQTNVSGRMTADNFGVIDAFGGAAIFETGNFSYTRFDATDPKVAPQGYIVRANFALTGRTGEDVGRARYDRANQLCRQAVENNRLDYRYVLRKVCRDFSGAEKVSYSWPEMDVTEKSDLEVLDTENLISNHLTNSVALFHGVGPDENPSFTTFWAILGQPILSVAVPCWVIAESTAPELDGEKSSPLCTTANDLYMANYVVNDKRKFLLNPEMLPSISAITYPAEDRIFDQTDSAMTQWRQDYPTAQQVASFHRSMASEAMNALEDTTEMLMQKGGPTASLRLALHMGSVEKAKAFIEGNTNINAPDGRGYTPLHYAVQDNLKEIVQLLISKNADINAKDASGQNPLDIAIRKNQKDIIGLLVANGAKPSSISTAAYTGDSAAVQAFLEQGVNVNVRGRWGPLHLAAGRGHKEVVGLLLEHGADVNARSPSHETALHVAARRGHKEVVELLLEHGADVNARSPLHQTALHVAARQEHKEVVELLLEHGADVNAGAGYNKTAAEFAMGGGHTEIVKLLISKGADISPLHFAIYMKNEAKARSLIEAGADVNKRTPYGSTPLGRAVSAGFKNTAKLLIDKGADVNAKDNWDWTPLHSAVYKSKEMVELLMAHGANVNAKDGARRTPLYYAKEQRHTEIVELLRKQGAKE